MTATVPHFKLPLHVNPQTNAFHVLEQDTAEEVAQSVQVVLATPLGTRLDLPDFGTPDHLFRSYPLDIGRASMMVAAWEPRATTHLAQRVIDDLTIAIDAAVKVRAR